jgi:hypothetical protein
MLELATKKHDKDHIKREHDLERRRREPFPVRSDPGMYSTFGDKQGYGGLVPTGWQPCTYVECACNTKEL